MATYPTEDDAERQEKLRQNTSFDPSIKTEDEVDPMHADSWAGGSIVPDAKEVARGEKPANRERGDSLPPEADIEDAPEVTRPWAPKYQDDPEAENDAAGRPKREHYDAPPPRDAPAPSKQDDEPGGRPKVTTW